MVDMVYTLQGAFESASRAADLVSDECSYKYLRSLRNLRKVDCFFFAKYNYSTTTVLQYKQDYNVFKFIMILYFTRYSSEFIVDVALQPLHRYVHLCFCQFHSGLQPGSGY